MRFTIYITPVPKARPRVNPFSKTVYTPKTTTEFQDTVREAVVRTLGRNTNYPVFDEPICVDIDFVFPRPAKFKAKKHPDGLIWRGGVPDRDNLDKAVLDGLKGVLWKDDCQVVDGRIRKFYAERNNDARVCIRVLTAGDVPSDTCDSWSAEIQDKISGKKEGQNEPSKSE